MNALTPSDLGRLFDAAAPALVLYARQWLPRDAAEDATQDAFVRLMAAKPSPENPRAWLFVAVRHAAIDGHRGEWRRAKRERAAAEDRGVFAQSPASAIDARDAAAALADLPPEQREVVTLKIWGGLTLVEIAAVVAAPVSTVHHRYHAALAALRARLEEPCRKK